MDIVDRLRFDAARCEATFSKGVASNITESADEIERLRGILRRCVLGTDIVVLGEGDTIALHLRNDEEQAAIYR